MNKILRTLKYTKSLIKYQNKALKHNMDSLEKVDVLKDLSQDILNNRKLKVNLINEHYLNNVDGSLIISNHQANIDIFVLLKTLPFEIRFIAKKELNNLPLLKTYIKLSKTYLLDRKDPRQGIKLLKEVSSNINKLNENVGLFCEGTRSKSQLMSEFKTGSLNILRKVNKPVIPVYIDKSYLIKNDEINVIIGEPIQSSLYNDLKAEELRDLVYEKIINLKKEYVTNKKYHIIGLGDSITFGEDSNQEYIDSYYDLFINKLSRENMIKTSYNFSIPSLSTLEIKDLIKNNKYQEYLKERTNNLETSKYQRLIKENDISINDCIKNADYLIMTCGSNDMLKLVEYKKIELDKVIEQCNMTYTNILNLVNDIKRINPYIHIIIFGFYFPYPHSKALSKYNKMDLFDKKLSKIKRKDKVSYISVYKEVEANKNKFLPNKRNIHFSKYGYEFYQEKLIKEFQKLTSSD